MKKGVTLVVKKENMNYQNYPILRLLLPYLLGIICTYFCNFHYDNYPYLLAVSLAIVLIFSILRSKLHYHYAILSDCGLFSAMLFLGIFATIDKMNPHLTDQQSEFITNGKFFRVCVAEQPVEKEKSIKIIAKIIPEKTRIAIREKAVLYFFKDENARCIENGDELLVCTALSSVEPAKNPDEFDNQKFLRRKGIYFTGYVPANGWRILCHHRVNFVHYHAHKLQRTFSDIFSRNGLDGDEYSIITAILLGNDDTMDPSLKAHYSAAGVSHILCVSGMHVGIIYMILNFLLKPLDRGRSWQFVKALLLLLAIWFYANITGLAPSVKRAATMFTFVTFGGILRRPVNVFHSLFASLFILLIINPLIIFEIGFEMSYLAVFGIVILQPRIAKLYAPKTRIGLYFWELMAVSVAAQLATAPMSIYYFGQFPNYFLLSNISVMALSFLIVVTGVVLLAISWLPIISSFIGTILTFEIRLLNGIVKGIDSLPGSVTENISLHFIQTLVLYGILVVFYLWIVKKHKFFRYAFLSSLLFFLLSVDYYKYQSSNNQSIMFYSMDKMSAISCRQGETAVLMMDSLACASPYGYAFHIRNHERMAHYSSVPVMLDTVAYVSDIVQKSGNFFVCQGHRFFILRGGDWLYPGEVRPKVEYLCLQQSPRIPVSKLKQVIDFEKVIIDGSNTAYWASRWQDSCRLHQIPCYSTRENGYLSIQSVY